MQNLTIKEHDVEFTFEAAESDTVQKVFDYFSGTYMLKGLKTEKKEEDMTEEEKTECKIAQMDALVGGMSIIPKLSIDLLYMGLLEHHGVCGDKTQDILTRNDAKNLYKQFCKENPDSEIAMHSGLFEALKIQMETDGFFKRIGLEQMIEKMSQPSPKVPQDHKKKNTKQSDNA